MIAWGESFKLSGNKKNLGSKGMNSCLVHDFACKVKVILSFSFSFSIHGGVGLFFYFKMFLKYILKLF
jgi:hypothetical protein